MKVLTIWSRNIEIRCKAMNVATHTVAVVCHPKHSDNWDFPL